MSIFSIDSPIGTGYQRLVKWLHRKICCGDEVDSGWRVVFWCFLMSVVSVAAWMSQGFDRTLDWGINLNASAEEVLERVGPKSDISHYIQAGDELSSFQEIHSHYRRYWTLGMPATIAMIKAFGGWNRYPLAMGLVSAIAWGIALGIGVNFLSPRGLAPVGATCATLLWFCADLRDWVFGTGALLSGSIGSAWLVAGIAMMMAALAKPNVRHFGAAGLLLGFAVNFRYQYLLLSRPVLALMVVGLLFMMWRNGYKPKTMWAAIRGRLHDTSAPPRQWMESALRGMTVCLLVFVLTLLPWSAYKLAMNGTLKWYTASQRLKYSRMWTPDEKQPGWSHAANAQCHADPVLCAELNANWGEEVFPKFKSLGIITTVRHPLVVAKQKLRGFSWLWWGKSWDGLSEQWRSFAEGLILLLSGIAGVIVLAWRTWRNRHPAYWIATLGLGSMLLYHAAMFTFIHFEWRFSLPLRALCAMAPWWVLGYMYRVEYQTTSLPTEGS